MIILVYDLVILLGTFLSVLLVTFQKNLKFQFHCIFCLKSDFKHLAVGNSRRKLIKLASGFT